MENVLEDSYVSVFRQRSTEPGGPLDWVILNHRAPQKQQLVKICTWEQI